LKKDNKKYKGSEKSKDDDNSDEDRVSVSSDSFLIVRDHDVVNAASHDLSWVIDSGATTHATSEKDYFVSYTAVQFGTVKMGDDTVVNVVGIGDVCLETNDGTKLVLRNVKHVPSICLNLISVGKLDDEGFCSTFKNGNWKLSRGAMIVAKGKKFSSLYFMQARLSKDILNAVKNDDIELWHKRLGHMSEKGMTVLAKQKVISGVQSIQLKRCSHCIAGKQSRVSFKSHPPSRKPSVLDLVHSDVCGPMKKKTLGGSLYFVTFIDDHSRKTWVYTLKTKDQVLQVFKHFQASVERETGKKLKCIRTDNGGEYSGPFDEYCREHGIRHQKTPPKTPQLNGVAERMNRTLIERVRCLLSHAGLPGSFWGEALNTAVHVLNRSPCIPL